MENLHSPPLKIYIPSGFSLIELMVTLTIAAILFLVAIPSYQNSVAEHKALDFVEALKGELEWARSQALSRGEAVTFTLPASVVTINRGTTSCATWDIFVNGVKEVSHSFTDDKFAQYTNLSCTFSGSSPRFNSIGLNTGTSTFVATISSPQTSRQWKITVDGSGNTKVTAQ